MIGYQRAFVFECQENQKTETPVTYIAPNPQLIYAAEPSLCSEPQSLYSETNEVRGWDAICWDSVASHNVDNNETLSAEGVVVNMVNDHESIQDTQTDIDTQFILWNIIYHQTCSINKLLECTQFTEQEIQSALLQLDKIKFIEPNTRFGYVLSNELLRSTYKPLMVELQRRFGSFALYNQNKNVSAFSFMRAMNADYSQIDYFGIEYEVNDNIELMIESDLSLQSPSTIDTELEIDDDFMSNAFIQKHEIDEILSSFDEVHITEPKVTEIVQKGIYFYDAEDV